MRLWVGSDPIRSRFVYLLLFLLLPLPLVDFAVSRVLFSQSLDSVATTFPTKHPPALVLGEIEVKIYFEVCLAKNIFLKVLECACFCLRFRCFAYQKLIFLDKITKTNIILHLHF